MMFFKRNKIKCFLIIAAILSLIMAENVFAYYDSCDCLVYSFIWKDDNDGQYYSETVLERANGGYDKGFIQPGERFMALSKESLNENRPDAPIPGMSDHVTFKLLDEVIGIDTLARITYSGRFKENINKVTLIDEYFDPDVPGTEICSFTDEVFDSCIFDIYTFDRRAYFETSSIKSPNGGEYIRFWEAFEVTAEDDGHGSAVSSERYGKEGAKASLQAVPDDGYQFKEWQVVSGKARIEDEKSAQTPFEFGDEDAVIKAVFEKRQFSVTVFTDGYGQASSSASSALFDSEISLSATPYEGYKFKEWKVLSGNVDIVDDCFRMPYSDVTLKAVFEKDTEPQPLPQPLPEIYCITFDPAGGSVTCGSDYTDEDGRLASLPVPVREGYKFKGWWTLTEGGDEVTVDTVFDRDVTVFAHWEKKPEEVKYKLLDLEGRKLNGAIPRIRLYYPRNIIAYDGKEHVAVGTRLSSSENPSVAADLEISVDGVPQTVSSDYFYGKTRFAISYYGLTLFPDTSSDLYKALGDKEKKRMEQEIKKINKVLKKKKNRIYYAVKPLDLNEFVFDRTKSKGAKKVFFRIDNSGDTLVLMKRNRRYFDPEFLEYKRDIDIRLQITLSGYKFAVPHREYKSYLLSGNSKIKGKNINLIGETIVK